MQSGRANTKRWLLEFEPESAREVEPLMGWTSSRDTRSQLNLWFDSKDEAIAYAKRHNLMYQVEEPRERAIRIVGIGAFVLGLPSAINLGFLHNQDWVWAVALMVSGLFLAIAVIRYGVQKFRDEQINHELHAAYLYLSMAAHFEVRSLEGFGSGSIDHGGDLVLDLPDGPLSLSGFRLRVAEPVHAFELLGKQTFV